MRAVIFDMGGVLVDLDVEMCKKAFRDELGFAEIDEVLDACHQKGVLGEMEAGMIGAEDFRSYVVERSREGVKHEDVDHALYKIPRIDGSWNRAENYTYIS